MRLNAESVRLKGSPRGDGFPPVQAVRDEDRVTKASDADQYAADAISHSANANAAGQDAIILCSSFRPASLLL